MRLLNTHPWIDICMKIKWITTKSIGFRFSWSEKLRVLFTNWPGIPCTAFFCEIRWPVTYAGATSIAENGNAFFKCFFRFRSKLCHNKSVRDAIRVLLFLYHNFMKTKCFLSNWISAYTDFFINMSNAETFEKHFSISFCTFKKACNFLNMAKRSKTFKYWIYCMIFMIFYIWWKLYFGWKPKGNFQIFPRIVQLIEALSP